METEIPPIMESAGIRPSCGNAMKRKKEKERNKEDYTPEIVTKVGRVIVEVDGL